MRAATDTALCAGYDDLSDHLAATFGLAVEAIQVQRECELSFGGNNNASA
jgi:hypothetical protein